MFDTYCKFDKNQIGKMTYKSYIQMGLKASITPQIISSQDYIYIYKTIMKSKKNNELQKLQNGSSIINSTLGAAIESQLDLESSKLDISEFKEALIKIACLSKQKLGGLT